ncbi:MAG: ATP synthase F1 subunit delta [Flavobacteriales bacterium]|nr:MAG: ATP synthase F1 subunit delta [Flavobacteriales bacterium]
MLTSKVAKRYAQGFLDFAQESKNTDAIYTEMKEVVKTVNNSRELELFFATPFIDYKKKMSVASEIFKSFSSTSQNMISLVIKQGREKHLKNIAQEFINKVEDLKGIQRVSLTTAKELSPENIKQILASTTLVNTTTEYDLETKINPDLLGGYVLRVGDQQIDASVQTKLNKLRKDFQVN